MGWFFHYQVRGKEDTWNLAMSSEREKIVKEVKPAFTTVLDLTSVPSDSDWTKVRYKGPLYFDFDADGDLELACTQLQVFLGKLDSDMGFDVRQAYIYASGSKGFHVEIPELCFMPKATTTGTAWLPYIYRKIAEDLYVDTLDLRVYTGKRGRMWRTPNVQRENGMFKVAITLDEAMAMTPELYAELIVSPRDLPPPAPPHMNPKLALAFTVGKEKIASHMRGKKRRQEKANAFLDPWKKSKQHPPTIERIMQGEGLSSEAGFQSIAMQLAIYATSVGMSHDEFLERSKGLCESHVSDSRRYNSFTKRQSELTRMFEYMGDNTLYDFEIGPIVRLLPPGSSAPDLGMIETEDREDAPPPATSDDESTEATDTKAAPSVDTHVSMRRGFFMNADGMFVRKGDNVESVCRATLRSVEAMTDVEFWDDRKFRGYEFDLVSQGRKPQRVMLGAEAFTSSQRLKQFFTAYQLSFQGSDTEAAALLDIMAEKASKRHEAFVYPREGFFVVGNPHTHKDDLVKCYLTQTHFMSSLSEDDPNYFKLRYRPVHATSGYHIDIHNAPKLTPDMAPHIDNFFRWNKPEVLGDLIGWFVAAHYRALYMHVFNQFPSLHIWGLAGTGKSKSVELLSSLHWYNKDRIPIKTATASTPFALEVDASTSTSAPMIIDEWKPRELRAQKGKYEKLKDVVKSAYSGIDVSNKGTINRHAPESSMGVIRGKSTAPIVFIAEAIESETALFERSLTVSLKASNKSGERQVAWEALYENVEGRAAISALGREIVEWGFAINMDVFKSELITIRKDIRDSDRNEHKGAQAIVDRIAHNKAVSVHGLTILRRVLKGVFGDRYNAVVDDLIGSRSRSLLGEEGALTRLQSMSEAAKVINRLAILSRSADSVGELAHGQDYLVGPGWVEVRLESCYDKYRRYCVSVGDTALYDNLEGFIQALNGYHALIDHLCVSSELRRFETEKIYRLDTRKMITEGIQEFKS